MGSEVIRTALDTSVVVPALLDWHDHHARALAAVVEWRGAGRRLVVPIPALIQSYSVMTRLPRRWRVTPDTARSLLSNAFAAGADLVAQNGDAAWSLFDRVVSKGVAGGGIHDADILACAERAGAKRLLTLNPVDFERLGPTSVEIVVP